jgi:hypothetical protein
MYNSLVDLYRLPPQIHKIPIVPPAQVRAVPAQVRQYHFQDFQGLAQRNVADQREIEYEQITLQDFVLKLDILFSRYMEDLDEEVRLRNPISEIKEKFYVRY